MFYEDAPVVERAMLRQLAGIALSLTKQRSFACKALLFRLQSNALSLAKHRPAGSISLLCHLQSIAFKAAKHSFLAIMIRLLTH